MTDAPQLHPKKEIRLRVDSVTNETGDIKRYELVSPTGTELPAFTAGAHIDVITGNQLRRSYSLANAPNERHRYVIAVLREPAGRGGSAWMHDRVKQGDVLKVAEPLNNLELRDNAAEHNLLGGGNRL